jgi:hypothetical protein
MRGAAAVVLMAAALYLLALGIVALLRPAAARRFLGGFASSRRIHFIELAVRVAVGAALVVSAPRMMLGTAMLALGWMLVSTSAVLAVVPWQMHRRFAAWSVPRATQYIALIGVGAVAAGVGLMAALVLPGAQGR